MGFPTWNAWMTDLANATAPERRQLVLNIPHEPRCTPVMYLVMTWHPLRALQEENNVWHVLLLRPQTHIHTHNHTQYVCVKESKG